MRLNRSDETIIPPEIHFSQEFKPNGNPPKKPNEQSSRIFYRRRRGILLIKEQRFTESQMQNELFKEALEKVVKPSQRKVMEQWAVQNKSISIVLVCTTFGVSETCYRYRPALNDDNEEIANWSLSLTTCHKRWGFGLCFFIESTN